MGGEGSARFAAARRGGPPVPSPGNGGVLETHATGADDEDPPCHPSSRPWQHLKQALSGRDEMRR